MRAQLLKPGACGVLSLEVKYDPAFRLKCTATLIIDDIRHSRKSCHHEYEFKTVPFTIPCCKLHFYHPKLLHIKLQFSKRNKQTPLLPLPEINSIYHAESAGSRDQPRPGSYLKKREEPGNEVVQSVDISLILLCQMLYNIQSKHSTSTYYFEQTLPKFALACTQYNGRKLIIKVYTT